MSFPGGSDAKEPTCQCRRCKRQGLNPCVRKISWGRKWQPIPVLLPGKFHREASWATCSPWSHKEHAHTHNKSQLNTSEMPKIDGIALDEVCVCVCVCVCVYVGMVPSKGSRCAVYLPFFFFFLLACKLSPSVVPTLCDPVDCRPPGSSVHRISQAGILKWVANSYSRVSS